MKMWKITTAFGIGPLKHVKGGYLENSMWPRTIKNYTQMQGEAIGGH